VLRMLLIAMITSPMTPFASGQTTSPPAAKPLSKPKQSAPMDVDGWARIKWGMTVTQAKAIYAPDAREPEASDDGGSTKYAERLIIQNLELTGVTMRVSIRTLPGSDRVKEVELSMPKSNFTEPSFSRAVAHEAILNALTLKYGEPTRHEHNDQPGSAADSVADVWVFPSTTISLQSIEIKVGFGLLNLQYTSVDRRLKDVL
jgi:hypothetical protein